MVAPHLHQRRRNHRDPRLPRPVLGTGRPLRPYHRGPVPTVLGASPVRLARVRGPGAPVLDISAGLTDTQKTMAEYWADGPRSETPPGHWNLFAQFVSHRDGQGLNEDVKLFFALNNAIFDGGISCWDTKGGVRLRASHYRRPLPVPGPAGEGLGRSGPGQPPRRRSGMAALPGLVVPHATIWRVWLRAQHLQRRRRRGPEKLHGQRPLRSLGHGAQRELVGGAGSGACHRDRLVVGHLLRGCRPGGDVPSIWRNSLREGRPRRPGERPARPRPGLGAGPELLRRDGYGAVGNRGPIGQAAQGWVGIRVLTTPA